MPFTEAQTGRPGDNCDWEIRAAAYDFSLQVVRDWFLENIIKPVMKHGDGVWLDGDGPDNGGWMCSGSYDYEALPKPYPPLNDTEIDAFCVGENAVQEAAHDWLFANGGMDGQACWTYVTNYPVHGDTSAQCAAKLVSINELNASTAVGFAMDRTGGKNCDDTCAPVAIAAFLLTRKDQWFYGVTQESNSISTSVAALMLSDYGAPMGGMTQTGTVFRREFTSATVTLDCSTMTATFTQTV